MCLNQAIQMASLSATTLLGLSEDLSPTQPNLWCFFHYQWTQAASEFIVGAVTSGSLVELASIVACESSLCRGSLPVPRESIPRI